MHQRLPGFRGGLTLAELLVGLFVLACAVLALVAAEIYLARSERGSRGRQEASLVANNLLTQRLALDFEQDCTRGRTLLSENLAYAVDERTSAPDLRQITVSVYFVDNSEWRQYDLSTYLCSAR